MSDVINHLQHRIEQTREDLQSATERLQAVVTERALLESELQGYEKALAAEMRRQGMPAALKADSQEILPLRDAAEPAIRFAERPVNKAQFAREFIRECPDGATPAEIYQGFLDNNIPIDKPYIYALVQRLRKQGAIKDRRGKWYPVPESERLNGAGSKALP